MVNVTSSGLSSTSRIFPAFTRASSQREVERRTLFDGAFGPDPAAMPVDDAAHGGEPNPGAFEFRRRMEPLKHAEQLVGVAHVEAGAIVLDHEHATAVFLLRRELHARLRLLAGVFPAVAQEIVEDDAQ